MVNNREERMSLQYGDRGGVVVVCFQATITAMGAAEALLSRAPCLGVARRPLEKPAEANEVQALPPRWPPAYGSRGFFMGESQRLKARTVFSCREKPPAAAPGCGVVLYFSKTPGTPGGDVDQLYGAARFNK